jgi:hypothetical protein
MVVPCLCVLVLHYFASLVYGCPNRLKLLFL